MEWIKTNKLVLLLVMIIIGMWYEAEHPYRSSFDQCTYDAWRRMVDHHTDICQQFSLGLDCEISSEQKKQLTSQLQVDRMNCAFQNDP